MRPRLLDLFCCAGGAGRGYADAGFDVLGVDILPQPDYPLEFHQGDALDFLREQGRGFDAIHASPPCQRHSIMTRRHGRQDGHPDLIPLTRKLLEATGQPWVIENVVGAPLRDPVTLCGSMFGLGAEVDGEWRQLRRHRLFESNVPVIAPGPCDHRGQTVGVYGKPGGGSRRDGIRFARAEHWQQAMRIDWTSARNIAQAIPPAYTEHLGRLLFALFIADEGKVA
jgi:DNA (cytosine-5)-methyltransferase 1